jgi:hypothetical protein
MAVGSMTGLTPRLLNLLVLLQFLVRKLAQSNTYAAKVRRAETQRKLKA